MKAARTKTGRMAWGLFRGSLFIRHYLCFNKERYEKMKRYTALLMALILIVFLLPNGVIALDIPPTVDDSEFAITQDNDNVHGLGGIVAVMPPIDPREVWPDGPPGGGNGIVDLPWGGTYYQLPPGWIWDGEKYIFPDDYDFDIPYWEKIISPPSDSDIQPQNPDDGGLTGDTRDEQETESETNPVPEFVFEGEKPAAWAEADVVAAINAGLVPQGLRKDFERAITRAEFAALAAAFYEAVTGAEVAARQPFEDTDDINVEKMAALGVVQGMGGNLYLPGGELTREQAAAILSRLAEAVGKPLPEYAATFSDIDSVSDWAIDAVGQMQASGIMEGVGGNTFSPQGPYTTEQSIVTLLRLYEAVK